MTNLRSLDDLVADQAEIDDLVPAASQPRQPMTLACRWDREPGTGALFCTWEMVPRPKLGLPDLH